MCFNFAVLQSGLKNIEENNNLSIDFNNYWIEL